MSEPLISIGQAAALLETSMSTIRRMETSGELEAVRTRGGHRRYNRTQVQALQLKGSLTAQRLAAIEQSNAAILQLLELMLTRLCFLCDLKTTEQMAKMTTELFNKVR